MMKKNYIIEQFVDNFKGFLVLRQSIMAKLYLVMTAIK